MLAEGIQINLLFSHGCGDQAKCAVLPKCNVCGDEETVSAIWSNCPIGVRAKVMFFAGFFHNFFKTCLGL